MAEELKDQIVCNKCRVLNYIDDKNCWWCKQPLTDYTTIIRNTSEGWIAFDKSGRRVEFPKLERPWEDKKVGITPSSSPPPISVPQTSPKIVSPISMAKSIPKRIFGKLGEIRERKKEAQTAEITEERRRAQERELSEIEAMRREGSSPVGPWTRVGPPRNLKSNQVRCEECGRVITVNDKTCPCGKLNPAYIKQKEIGESVSKQISGRVYEILMFVIAGIVAWFVPPLFGLPPMQWLAFAFIIFIPFYTILPSERDVLDSLKEGTRVGREHITGGVGLLIVKAFIKLIIFGLVIFQFMIWPLVALVVTFIFYFSMPTHYKTSQIYKMLEAWFRMGVGAYLALLLFRTFGGTGGPLASWSFLLLGLAFFATFPEQSVEEDKGVTRIVISDKLHKNYSVLRKFDKLLWFLPLMIISLFTFMEGFTGFQAALGGNITYAIFIAVWVLSFFSGLVTGPEGRPVLGILVIFIALFAFSSTYTGVMGQAIFGYWWPQVESFGSMIGETVGPMWSQATGGMSDAWMLLTNPAQYYNIQMQKQQASKTVVKSGGTTKSIELTKTDLFTSMTGILEPILDPLIGSYEIQNQGEFDANRIQLKIWASWKDPVSLNEICTGRFSKFDCSSPGSTLESSSGVCEIGTCNWSNTTYPNEIKLSTFVFEKNSWLLEGADNLNICNPADCTDPNSTYNHSSQTIKINANITYDYNVNVSIPAEVIDWDVYLRLLQSREITLQELTSQYTGGPVKATLWSQKQPIRSGEVSLFIASIYNDGIGEIISVSNFKIKIPEELGIVEKVSSTFYGSGGIADDGCDTPTPKGNYIEINCNHTWSNHPIKPGEFKRVSFLITPPKNIPVDRMTRLITGLANYAYIKTKSQSITIATSYPH